MPHLKVKPFSLESIERITPSLSLYKATEGGSDMVLFDSDKEKICLDIIKREKEYLVKPNKITRGADSQSLKEILDRFAKICNLEVLHSNIQMKRSKPKIAHKYLKSIEEFYDFRSDYKKIKLEIGFGSGRHLLYRAKEERETLFIGVEIHSPSIEQLLKQITLQGIENILVVNYDARLLLEMLQSNSLEMIYVHFPVPWDKKPHRRVISKAFVEQALRTLKKGGILELRTDSENYYRYALEVFSSPKRASFKVEKNREIEIISKYEARWRRMNKDIYTLSLQSLEESPEKKLELNFDFDTILLENKKLPKESIVKRDYFVHFGKVYKKSSGYGYAIECSFGSFSMPEKKMIIVEKEGAFYLPSRPVKSRVNQEAHNLIKEVFNG